MKLVSLILAAVSLSGLLSPLIRPSNSQKLSERGLELWNEEKYGEAAQAFAEAREIRTTAASTFDLGTALVGAREHQRGEDVLRSLTADEALAAPSAYNTGNSQLVRGALDEAIESYSQTLRIESTNLSEQRNLEIALRRKSEQQQSGGSGEGEDEEEQNPSGGEGQDDQESENLDPDLEKVLRSIDQQEREELSRMRRANAIRRPTDW